MKYANMSESWWLEFNFTSGRSLRYQSRKKILGNVLVAPSQLDGYFASELDMKYFYTHTYRYIYTHTYLTPGVG